MQLVTNFYRGDEKNFKQVFTKRNHEVLTSMRVMHRSNQHDRWTMIAGKIAQQPERLEQLLSRLRFQQGAASLEKVSFAVVRIIFGGEPRYRPA